MRRRAIRVALGLGLSLLTIAGGELYGAADCGEPMAAPKWGIGDNWTFQDELGEEKTETMVGFEGGLMRLEWAYPDRKVVLFFDPDFVLQKVITREGTILERPGRRGWNLIGVKQWQFPLHVGKTWTFSYEWDGKMFWNDSRVVACEEISIIAGKFSALKVEQNRRRADGRWQGILYQWFAPSAKRIVRGEFQRPNFGPDVKDWELLRYRVN